MRTIMVILIENEGTIINYIIYENFMNNFECNGDVIIIDMQV
mgnify:CR=1 FL=1